MSRFNRSAAYANPVGLNPYVSYTNSTAVITTNANPINLVVSPLVPVATSYNFGVPVAQTTASLHADPTDSEQTMEAWLQSLDKSVSNALLREMMKGLGGV